MSDSDDIRRKAEELKGGIEEKAGTATGDDELERKGQRDQAGSKLKQAGEKLKDAAKDATGR
jgi:uncharacterized protein YjbJ (UPF0337 family)